MKRKFVKTSIITLLICCAVTFIYYEYLYVTYVDREVSNRLKTENYKIVLQKHTNHDWYAKVIINQKEGKRFFNLYKFRLGYKSIDLRNKPNPDAISEDNSSWYYMDPEGVGVYGYTLYHLNHDTNQLEIYQVFGN